MTAIKFIALIVAVLAAGAGAGSGQDQYYGGYNGIWEGKLKFLSRHPDDPTFVAQSSQFDRKFLIRNELVRVYNKENGDWVEIKPDAFRIVTHKTNAVIFAVNSGDGWVETWNFTITHKGKNDLYVYFVRSVNNYERAADYKDPNGRMTARFFLTAFGEMTRSD